MSICPTVGSVYLHGHLDKRNLTTIATHQSDQSNQIIFERIRKTSMSARIVSCDLHQKRHDEKNSRFFIWKWRLTLMSSSALYQLVRLSDANMRQNRLVEPSSQMSTEKWKSKPTGDTKSEWNCLSIGSNRLLAAFKSIWNWIFFSYSETVVRPHKAGPCFFEDQISSNLFDFESTDNIVDHQSLWLSRSRQSSGRTRDLNERR